MTQSEPQDKPDLSTHRTRDGIVAGVAMATGLALVVSSRTLPPGIGALPGPGFFPLVLGVLVMVFAGMIASEARSAKRVVAQAAGVHGNLKLPAVTMALVLAYLVLWGIVPFLARTPFLAIALMKLAGASWRQAVLAAAVITAFLHFVFVIGLRVNLD